MLKEGVNTAGNGAGTDRYAGREERPCPGFRPAKAYIGADGTPTESIDKIAETSPPRGQRAGPAGERAHEGRLRRPRLHGQPLVDPIDGTTTPSTASLLASGCREALPTISARYPPGPGEQSICRAQRGHGATMNGTISGPQPSRRSRPCCSTSAASRIPGPSSS